MPSAAREQELLDRMWERVAPLLPPRPPQPKGGRPWADDKTCFAGIVYVLRNGIRWNDLPRCFPSDTTCWRRQDAWARAGVWEQVHRVILEELAAAGKLDTSELFADATFAEDRKGGRAPAAPGAGSG
jgi:transposase